MVGRENPRCRWVKSFGKVVYLRFEFAALILEICGMYSSEMSTHLKDL